MLQIRTVLFPTDDSPPAERARAVAERYAQRHGATLHVLRVEVVPPAGDLRFDPVPEPAHVAPGVVEARRRFPTAADAILLYADEVDADLVVMGTHGRSGFDRLTLGSTAEHVLRRAECPVLTVGPEADPDATGPVLVPLAFESASDVAAETAVELAAELGLRVVGLHVVEPVHVPVPYMMAVPPVDQGEIAERVGQTLERWVRPYADRVPIETEVRLGSAGAGVLAAAREHGAGLVVQSSHGRRGIGRWLLGSVSEGVVRRAPCPVLTLRVGARSIVRIEGGPDLAVPRDQWPALFDALSRRAAAVPHAVTVEVVSPEAEGSVFADAPLVGVTFDPRNDELDVIAEGGGHHVLRPFAVRSEAGAWAVDGAEDAAAPGPWVLDVVGADGVRQRMTIRPVAEPVAA